jgi:hypothetical protein
MASHRAPQRAAVERGGVDLWMTARSSDPVDDAPATRCGDGQAV